MILHASAVDVDGRGLLILGPSGAGKSSLALRLLALGARLVSDDRVLVQAEGGGLTARCPTPAMQGLIEARGMGILRAPWAESTRLTLSADLTQEEPDRLPPLREITLLGHMLPLVLRVQNDHLAAALHLRLRFGRHG